MSSVYFGHHILIFQISCFKSNHNSTLYILHSTLSSIFWKVRHEVILIEIGVTEQRLRGFPYVRNILSVKLAHGLVETRKPFFHDGIYGELIYVGILRQHTKEIGCFLIVNGNGLLGMQL